MPYRQPVGIPEIDAIMALPMVQDTIARQVRYNQTRLAEAVLATMMISVGITLLWDGSTFALRSFAIIADRLDENTTGWISLLTGLARLWALWMNGRRNMPIIRITGCVGGFFFWIGWGLALIMTYPPLVPLGPIGFVLAGAEFITAGRAARDAYATDALGLRGRSRGADGSG